VTIRFWRWSPVVVVGRLSAAPLVAWLCRRVAQVYGLTAAEYEAADLTQAGIVEHHVRAALHRGKERDLEAIACAVAADWLGLEAYRDALADEAARYGEA
jgi:hypothetical protein